MTDLGSSGAAGVVAAFDCDGTLIRGDATRRFLLRLRGWPGLLLDLLTMLPGLLRWRLGRLSTTAFKQRLLGLAIRRGRPRLAAGLDDADAGAGPPPLAGQLRSAALERLRWHQRQGHRVVIVSASPRFLLEPLARHLQVPLLATETSEPQSASPGQPFRLLSPNCKGPEKTRRLAAWLDRPLSAVQLHAYGDSRGDRELLQASSHPHWRSFSHAPRAYREPRPLPWAAAVGLLLLAGGLLGLTRLPDADRAALGQSLASLLRWLPAIYGLLIASHACRYGRWRVLLGSQGIGRVGWTDALIWLRGFALTATPGKLGELSRVQELHRRLGYPRPPLLHGFVAERCADLASVAILLALVAPGELLQRLPDPTAVTAAITTAITGAAATWLPVGLLVLTALAGVARGALRSRAAVRQRLARLRHHLPSGRLAAALPLATLVSLPMWVFEALILWLLVWVLSPTAVSLPMAIAIYLLSGLAGQASSIPGGLGVNEGATFLLLIQQDVPAAAALSVAILRRLFTIWSITGLAIALGGRRLAAEPSTTT